MGLGRRIRRFLWFEWESTACRDVVCRRCAAPWQVRAGSITSPLLPRAGAAAGLAPAKSEKREARSAPMADSDLAPEPEVRR